MEDKKIQNDASKTYWPSKEEYLPGITTEQWVDFLSADKINNPSTLEMLYAMLELGGEATCNKLSEF